MGQFSIGFGNRQTMGYTAQEVQEIVDKAIKDNFNNYMGVSGSLYLLLSEVVKTECAKTIEQALKDGKNEFSQELSALKYDINFDYIKKKLDAIGYENVGLNDEIDKLYGEYCNYSAELLSKCNSICDMLNSLCRSRDEVAMGQEEIKRLILRYELSIENANEQIMQTIMYQQGVFFDKLAKEGERIREQQAEQYGIAIGRLDAQYIEIKNMLSGVQSVLKMMSRKEAAISKDQLLNLDRNIDKDLTVLAEKSKNIQKQFNNEYKIKMLYNGFCSTLNKSIIVLKRRDNSAINACELNFRMIAEEIIACCVNSELAKNQIEQVKNTLSGSIHYVEKSITDKKNFYLTQKMVGQYIRLLGILLGISED